MPEYIEEQDEPTDESEQENQQPQQHPSQPLEIQPDGTWILGKGAQRWMPSQNQIGDLRWIVERDLRRELGVPPATALNKDKIEFHKRQLSLLDLAKQAPRCEHVFSDGRCCKAPRVKKGKLCYAHTLMEEKRPQELNLPPLEDANAVMLWLMDALRGLLEGRISEKTAGLMFYGLQLAMVNARFTTFRDVDFEEMVRKAPRDRRHRASSPSSPTSEKRALPQRTQRNTEESFTAEVAENAEESQRDPATAPSDRAATPTSETSEAKALPQRTQRNTKEDFTAENAEVAEKEEQAGNFSAKGAKIAKEEAGDFTAEGAEVVEIENQENGRVSRIDDRSEPQKVEVNPGLPRHRAKTPRGGDPGVESAKSIFSGVEAGEGVADNGPVPPRSEPPRKSSQSEILVIPKDVEHHLRR